MVTWRVGSFGANGGTVAAGASVAVAAMLVANGAFVFGEETGVAILALAAGLAEATGLTAGTDFVAGAGDLMFLVVDFFMSGLVGRRGSLTHPGFNRNLSKCEAKALKRGNFPFL